MRILFFVFFLPFALLAQPEIDSLQYSKIEVAVAAAEGKVLFVGGRQAFSNEIPLDTFVLQNKVVDIFDIQTGEWSQQALQYKKDNAKAVALGSDIYIAGNSPSLPDGDSRFVEVYNVSRDEWWELTLPTLEEVDVMTEENGLIFFAKKGKADMYNPADSTWKSIELSIGLDRNSLGIASCEGKVFFAGGGSPGKGLLDRVDVYDIASESLDSLNLSLPRTQVECECINGKVYFIGGSYDFFSYTDLIEVYDIANNAWDSLFLDENKIAFATAVLGNKLYVAGGIDERDDPSSTVEVFDTETGEKEFLQLSMARSEFKGTSYEGSIFFAGGNTDRIGPYTNRVDIFGELPTPTSLYGDLAKGISLFPNPVVQLLTIERLISSEAFPAYKIYSLEGKIVLEGRLGPTKSQIDMGSLTSGMYVLRLEGMKGASKVLKK